MWRCSWCAISRQDGGPRHPREIIDHGFFAPDALPQSTTRGTRARLAEVLDGAPRLGALVTALPPWWQHGGNECGRKHETPHRCAARERHCSQSRRRPPIRSRSSCRSRPAVRSMRSPASWRPSSAPRLQTDVVVENRGGAGGLLAVEQVAARAARRPHHPVRERRRVRDHQCPEAAARLRAAEDLRAGRARRRRADAVHREGGFADQDAARADREGEVRQPR